MRPLLLLACLLAACAAPAPAPATSSTTTAPPTAPVPPPSPPQLLTVDARCVDDAAYLLVHVALEMDYAGPRAKPGLDTRMLWHVRCEKDTGACEGSRIRLLHVDRGEPLHALDYVQLHGARLTKAPGGSNAYTVQWGPSARLLVDLDAGRVDSVETAEGLEGHGTTTCKAGPSYAN